MTGRPLYGVLVAGLFVAAGIYVVFAIVGNAGWHSIALECVGLAVFGAVALAGTRSRTVLAIGWATHALWDFPLHLYGPQLTYTPRWYPWLCGILDLVLAVALIAPRKSRKLF